MARPIKKGLDYFPLDIHLDEKWAIVEAKFGLEGFAILVKLLQKVYESGYYFKIDEYTPLLLSSKFGLTEERLSEMILFFMEIGFFDKKTWVSDRVITSEGIQRRYILACKGRTNIEMEEKYLLISEEELPSNITIIVNHQKTGVSEKKTLVSEEITEVFTPDNPQIKLNKTKENKTKENYSEKFEIAWSAGHNIKETSRKSAYRYWKSSLNKGFSEDELLVSWQNYLKTKDFADYLMYMRTFFGQDEHFEGFIDPDKRIFQKNKGSPRKNTQPSMEDINELNRWGKEQDKIDASRGK